MIKDEYLIKPITEMLLTIIEATEELIVFIQNNEESKFVIVSNDMFNVLINIRDISKEFKECNPEIKLSDACQCAIDSLVRIVDYFYIDSEKAINKLRFELCPILKSSYLQFRYWGCCYPNESKIESFVNNELKDFTVNKFTKDYEKNSNYKYELTIYVLAYNNLAYTKLCVESILKNIPKGLSYELILYNHGSNDGTKEYFESIKPHKQVDISINGAVISILNMICEGKYVLAVSNDVLIGKNTIDNVLKLIKSDRSIGWIVPSTSNISNFQSIDANYSNFSEYEEFCANNNIYSIKKHEQKVRLCNPITMYNSNIYQKLYKEMYIALYGVLDRSFPDDKCSLWYRRNGYKLILAKDSYCHHFGSVTLKNEVYIKEKYYTKGRISFYSLFNFDPWEATCCFDPVLIDNLSLNYDNHVEILGINCGLGSNPLKIKESIKELTGNEDIKITNLISEKRYACDIKGVSDVVIYFENVEEIFKIIEHNDFDFIIMDNYDVNEFSLLDIIKNITKLNLKKCYVCLKSKEDNLMKILKKENKQIKKIDNWIIIKL